MYKILTNQVPNPGIIWQNNERTGIKAKLPERNNKMKAFINNLRENFFTTTGPKLFNCLPKEVRNFQTESQNQILCFKNNLDKYLTHIPDQPNCQSLQSQRQASSNSIIDQIHYIRPNNLNWSFST